MGLHPPVTAPSPYEVLHYVGYDDDRGGVISIVRALAATGRFDCVLGLNEGAHQHRIPALAVLELPRIVGEKINPFTLWRARVVARAVQGWLRADARRIFHGHSRAGLLVGLWLHRWGERRVVVSVHCYGRQRWFYRWAARQLGEKLFWLSPQMRHHYGLPAQGWKQCIPGGVPLVNLAPAGLESGKLRLGGVGTLVAWKGWHRVIEAIARLPEDVRKGVVFQHVGGGDPVYRDTLLRAVSAARLEEQISFRGEEPDSSRLLGEIDVLVVASDREPLAMSMLEALAAGIPVLAARSGGALDVIQGGVNGRFYAPGDVSALAQAIEGWVRDQPCFDREAVRLTTRSITAVASQWGEVYAQL